MKRTVIFRLTLGLLVIPFLAFWLALTSQPAQAQDPDYPATAEKFSREELAQMLGPIALYPDKLLSQILMAATYPLEVIEADRWIKKNPGLAGDTLDRTLLDKNWDPSVKALCHFPATLALMSERITETTNLGNAFLVQETEVMDMVQELRAEARARGNLTTTPKQRVVVENQTIVIEPADPRFIYVPYYDPLYIYGPWWYPAYRPYYWGPPRVSLGIGMFFSPGIYFGFSFGDWSFFDWHHHHISINAHARPRYVRHDRWQAAPGRWSHAPVHRRGVAYRDKFTATKYGQYPQRPGDFRGTTRDYPERREQNLQNRRPGNERIRIDQNRRGEETSRDRRSHQEQHRVASELQKRSQQPRQPAEQNRPVPPTITRTGQEPTRTKEDRQVSTRADRSPRKQERQGLRPVAQTRPEQAPLASEVLRSHRYKVFTQQENGRSERHYSERGQASRQEQNDHFRGQSRSGGGGGESRDSRGHNRS